MKSTATTTRQSGSSWVAHATVTTTNSYARWDGAATLTGTQIVTDTASGTDTDFNTAYSYTPSGTIASAVVTDGRPRRVTWRSDVLGLTTRRDEAQTSGQPHAGGDPHAAWYRFDGQEIGTVGNDGAVPQDYAASIAMRTAPAGNGGFRNGATTPTPFARFGQAADARSMFAGGAGGGSVTIGAGDALQSIAAQVWGDANLWYKLAGANGLNAGSVLPAGTTLAIPAGVTRSTNAARRSAGR